MNKNFKKIPQFKSIPELLKVFPTEQKCIKYFEKLRWRGIITSPFDPNSKVYKCKNNRYKCKNTGKYFNVRTGTVFEGSKIDLRNWLYVLYKFVNHKNELGGNLIARIVPDTKKKTLEPLVRTNIKEGSSVYTDEWLAYQDLGKWFHHQIVNHRKKQYVNGKATTNRIENVWSHLKRNIYGIYHRISRKHAQKYVDEFALRFNTRKYKNQDRFNLAFSSMIGKRLTYQQLIR